MKDCEEFVKLHKFIHSPLKICKSVKDVKDVKDFGRDIPIHISRKCIKMYILRYLIAFQILHEFLYCKKVKEIKRFCVSKDTMTPPWGILHTFIINLLILIYINKISFTFSSRFLHVPSLSFTFLEKSNRGRI